MAAAGDGLKYAFLKWGSDELIFAQFEKILIEPMLVKMLDPLGLPKLIESHPLHKKIQQKTVTLYVGVNLNNEK